MNLIAKAAQSLRHQAEELELLIIHLEEPQSDYTLKEAIAKLAAVLGRDYSFNMRINGYCGQPEVEWTVWDGKKSHASKTMAGAVNAAIASNQKPAADPVEQAQGILTPLPL